MLSLFFTTSNIQKMTNQKNPKLSHEFLTKLALGKVDKTLLPKSKRKLAGKTAAIRAIKARRMMTTKGESWPSYLSKSETRRLLLIYYWDHRQQLQSDKFYHRAEWRLLRALIFEAYGEQCMSCGGINDIAVDHIKSRFYFPDLELDPFNMQVLCRSCNSSKGSRLTTDYRPRDWKHMLTNIDSIMRFREAVNTKLQKNGSAPTKLPRHLSLTECCKIQSANLHAEDVVLTTLEIQLMKIANQLSTLQADGQQWWVGIETNRGWVKRRWDIGYGYRNRRSLKKLLTRIFVDVKMELSEIQRIHLSARELKAVNMH